MHVLLWPGVIKMEAIPSPPSIKLVVKTPNQQVKDIEVRCLLDWTVEKLKSHLSTVYPTKPARSSQKIIYSGRLLDDHFVLKDVLQESGGNHQTVHLVCTGTPSSLNGESSQTTASVPSSQPTSIPQSTPSSSTTMEDTTQPDGLRHRNHVYPHHPFYNPQFGHLQHFPNQVNVNTNMAGPMHMQYLVHPNAQYFGAHNIHYAAQHMAQQMAQMHWMQHLAQGNVYNIPQGNVYNIPQGNVYNMPGFPVQQNIPTQPNVAQRAAQANENPAAAAVPEVPQAQERRENRNMVMNANAGGGMMQADDDDEENGQRDWLDYIYMAVRIFMLLSIFWFYSSPERLIIMGAVIFIVWLIQSGVFNLNRAPRNRQPEIPVNEGYNNASQEEPGEESATEEGEDVIEGDSESESESQAEDETDNTNNNENNPGFFAVGYTFFVTFFTSLIPQAPRPIAQP